MENEIKELARLWESIVSGESVLAEYDSLVLPYKGFYYLISWAKEKDYHIVIIDVLDTLYLYKTQIALAGLDTSIVDNAKVIKVGGRLNVGNILARLPATDFPKLLKDFERIYDSHLSEIKYENSIVIVLGLSKLLLLAESKFEGLMVIDLLIRYTGTQRRTAFYFVNVDVLENSSCYLIPLLEELATTVIKVVRARKEEDIEPYVYVKVVKAINAELEGFKIKL
ncbi:hypothetical protein E3E31_08895 [Thermococcus sp. M39]|uniref:DUF257 family protein n=1 Tax=unclassified Thermococcus TaxID=2627626 RepID=UPI0014394762|nr:MULTISPECIES: DUF257 family protein [unclassified Thermococcus]NJE08634.1 hypothetical protein [Thermococcus sp. M39]NJE13242.1 hypothetical protein [Thermococcus sp. LS2]